MKLKRILFILSAVLAVNILPAGEPAGERIMTKWGETLDPANVWQEYPRPQLVREEWLNLNGLWEFAILPKNELQPTRFEGKILVPFCVESALSGVGKSFTAGDRIWYKRKISLPAHWSGSKIVLHFGAVDHEAFVYVNKSIVGSHKGGYDSFSFDITEYLRSGENELVVAVSDPTAWEDIPHGKQRISNGGIWYMPVSGIWQTVWLEAVNPEIAIEELKMTPDIDKDELIMQVFTDNVYFGKEFGVKISIGAEGEEIASALVLPNRKFSVKIPSPRLWLPDDPFLYDVKAEIYKLEPPEKEAKAGQSTGNNSDVAGYRTVGQALDRVESYFGMRKISLMKGKNNQPVICLNNQPFFMNGVLDQGWWPDGLYTPPSEEAMLFDMKYLKEAGFNMIRKHVKVESARYYYHADKLGLLVWQDMPSAASRPKGKRTGQFTGRHAETELIKKSVSAAQFEYEFRNITSMLYNHPAIVCWNIFNEGWGQYDTGRFTDYARGLDGSRLINAVSGWVLLDYGDIYSIHTYDVIPKAPENMSDRAIVIGEYGGIAYAVKDHTWNANRGGWGYQKYDSQEELENAYQEKFEEVVRQHREIGLSAAVYTQTTDIQGEVNGLLTYDRKVIKIPAKKLREIHLQIHK